MKKNGTSKEREKNNGDFISCLRFALLIIWCSFFSSSGTLDHTPLILLVVFSHGIFSMWWNILSVWSQNDITSYVTAFLAPMLKDDRSLGCWEKKIEDFPGQWSVLTVENKKACSTVVDYNYLKLCSSIVTPELSFCSWY